MQPTVTYPTPEEGEARTEIATAETSNLPIVWDGDEVRLEFDLGDLRLTVLFKVRINRRGEVDLGTVTGVFTVPSVDAANRIVPTLNLWRW